MSFDRRCSQPLLISKRRLNQCIARHSGIFCASVGFLQGLLDYYLAFTPQTESAVKCVWVVGGGHIQLLSCAYGNEAGMRPYSITL